MKDKTLNWLFTVLLKKDYLRISAIHSGEWLNRLTNDTVVVANGYVEMHCLWRQSRHSTRKNWHRSAFKMWILCIIRRLKV